MKRSIHHLILTTVFALIALTASSQVSNIVVDGNNILITTSTKFPFWLTTGQTINIGTNVYSISAIEYNVTTSPAGGNILTLSGVQKITSTYTVAANKTLKVEGVMLSTAASGSGTQWIVGGNTAPGSPVLGTVDNSPVSIQTGTGTLGVGADPASKTVNVGNSTGATTVNVNTGTGGYNLTTGTGGSATTTLGTGGNAVFGSSTAGADKIAILPQTIGGATNTGTITSADLTGARTYILPDATGTVAVSASGNIALSGAGNITLTGTVPSTNGGTGVSNAGTITNASNTTITGGGTLGLGGNTLTVPATGTAALGTGSNNYSTYWSGTNTLSAEQFTSVVRGGLGADMTAGAIGAIPYSSSTTAYGTLADVAAGSYLRSGGVGAAPVWSGIKLPNSATAIGELWYSSNTTTMSALAPSATTGTILMNTAGAAPSWQTLATLPSTAGIIPPANLGTGTPSGTSFLNGTGVWSVPSVTLAGGTNNALTYWNSSTTIAAATTGTPANGMYWDNSTGKLGIGTTTPAAKLDLKDITTANAAGQNIMVLESDYSSATVGSGGRIVFKYHGGVQEAADIRAYTTGSLATGLSFGTGFNAVTPRMFIDNAGNVAIGNTVPLAKFEVEGGSANWNETTPGLVNGSVHLDPGLGTDHFGSAITWGASDASSGENAQAGIYVRSDGNYGTKMYFGTTDDYSTGAKTRMYIGHTGNVGIGTTNPTARLEVNGQIKFTADASTMSKAPRQVTFTDPRAGCPPTGYAAGTNLFGGTITLATAATVSIQGTTIGYTANRRDLTLMIDGGEYFRWISDTGPTTAWQSATVHWSGTLAAGSHTIYLQGTIADVFGCGAAYGRIDVMIYEK